MADRPSILFVNQHYHPAFVSAGQRLTDLAEYLAGAGFDVHVLSSRGGYEGESAQAPKEEVRNGVHIRRLSIPGFGRTTIRGRLADYASFFVQALLRVVTGPRYSMVVVLTTPPLLGLVGALAKQLRGQPYAVWSMDLHPDAEKALGMVREGQWVTRLLDALNDRVHRQADFVVALGRFMKARIVAKGVDPGRVFVLPMWTKSMTPIEPSQNPYLRRLGLEDAFVVLYAGNAGLAHRFEELCAAARRLNHCADIRFLFLGGGPRREEIERYAEQHGLTNIFYHDYVPREQLHHFLSLADVHILTLRHEMAGIAVPSKLYDSMAAGRPVLMIGPAASEPAETIAAGQCGYVIDLEEAGAQAVSKIVRAITELHARPERRAQMGRRARALHETTYTPDVVCRAWADLLFSAANDARTH